MAGGLPVRLDPAAVARVETKWRRIVTPQPHPEAVAILKELSRYEPVSMTFDQYPVFWDKAEGHTVSDRWGNRWIDFTSGIFVANTGHSHPRVLSAIRAQVDGKMVHSYYFPSELRAKLTRRLVEAAPPGIEKAFLLTTGSETTECALKLARMRGRKTSPGKLKMVCWTNSFHGKTLGAQTMAGRAGAKAWIGPTDPNIHHLLFPYPWDADGALSGAARFEKDMTALLASGVKAEDVAGFLLEPYQGWSALFYPADYVQAVRRWADEHGALLCFDEVQSGFGRTGRMFAHERFGVRADIICCGKGISSGVPLSAVLSTADILDADPSLNSTHSGNPLCAAAGLATLDVLAEERLPERAAALGVKVKERLEALRRRFAPKASYVFGDGLVWAVLLTGDKPGEFDVDLADRVTEACVNKGLLLIRTGVGSLKLGPPLTIAEDALFEGIDVLEEALAQCLAAPAAR
ncbi:MAG: aminotransferase class III-fold pyridoxal phosphate-dependent enzyme [Elusimicrobia bacterium]|nr:aminotransferase class III-fold pyridoxal phosphate-dependent enzyme [Elusimicrobiota bacterium]